MTDLDEMIRDCLGERAQTVTVVDPVPGAHERSRQITRRRGILLATAAVSVATAAVVAGVALSMGHPAGRGHHMTLVPAASSSPSPVDWQAPTCPSGQLPNLSVDESAPVQPISTLVPLDLPNRAFAFVAGNGGVFLVNGHTSTPNSLWILAHEGTNDATRFIVTKPGAMAPVPNSSGDGSIDYINYVEGWPAHFIGCEAQGS
jgi:hypothetical protein